MTRNWKFAAVTKQCPGKGAILNLVVPMTMTLNDYGSVVVRRRRNGRGGNGPAKLAGTTRPRWACGSL
jgi:hypothetical protein